MTMTGDATFWPLLIASAVLGDRPPYFSRDDIYYAECIPSDEIKTYKYYGNHSYYIAEQSNRHQCATWLDATASIKAKSAPVWYYPEESLTHNQCRSLDFTLLDKAGRKHAIAYFKLHSGAYPGPWCYAKMDDVFLPKACFTTCPDETHIKPTPRKQKSRNEQIRNFNEKIFDDVSNTIFNDYDWGPSSYYFSKPSDEKHSRQFAQNRETIFFLMIALVVLILVLVIGFHLTKKFFGQRNEVDAETISKDAPTKTLKKPETLKKPTQTSSNMPTGDKRLKAANVEASDSECGSTAVLNKQQNRQERETAV